MSSEFDEQNLVGIFVTEASDGMRVLAQALHPDSAGSLPAPEQLQEQYIVAHRIRGAASLYGYQGIAKMCERLEWLLEQGATIPEGDWAHAVDAMGELILGIQSQIGLVQQGRAEEPEAVERYCSSSDIFVVETPSEVSAAPSLEAAAPSLTEAYLLPVLDAEVLSYFAPEAEEYLDTIDGLVRILENNQTDEDATDRLFRTAHTLKGSSYTVGFRVIGDVAHPMEDCMVAVREQRAQLSGTLLQVMTHAAALIRLLLRRDPANLGRLQRDMPPILRSLTQLALGESVVMPAVCPPSHDPVDSALTAVPSADGMVQDELPMSDEYLVPHLDPEVLSYFAPEAQEYLETLESSLLKLDKDPQNKELINQLFRTAHTLKGSAYTVGFQAIGDLIHHVEDFMGAVRDGHLRVLAGHTDLMLRSVDVVRVLMRRDLTQVAYTRQRFATTLSELKRLNQEGAPESGGEQSTLSAIGVVDAQAIRPAEEQAQPQAADGKSAEDREVIRVSRDRLERLLNLVGELVIGRGRLEQRLSTLEHLSQQVLACKSRLVDSVQSFEEKHTFTYQASTPSLSAEPAPQGFPGVSDFGSLELDKYDDFNILARRISEVTADISESMSQLSGSIRRSHDDMSQLQQLTLGMRDEIARARMVPVGTPFTRFRRAIREMARASNKEVALVTSGEHTEVDTGVVERLVDPLIHLVRNAVYHGIELPADRRMKGKPSVGTVYLHAAHRGNSVIIEVEDDGAGLDLNKIRAKAVKLGLMRSEQASVISDAEALKCIFAPGFSTADTIGDQAGRGVGLDVVKRVIEGMNGHINVESVPGVGTKFTLDLPLTLLIATALLVRTGVERYAIPLPTVREVTMPTADAMQHMGERAVLQVGDEAIEVHALRHLLRREQGPVDLTMPIVIVRTIAGPVGLAVDELLGRQEIVVKTLGSLKPLEQSVFGGATIDPEGRVLLVIDPGRLMARDKQETSMAVSQDTTLLTDGTLLSGELDEAHAEAPILLIDDSLSIRKFVGRMLENAGYQVDTAVDGEDGLRKASGRSYRLIFTDLEMPKLNGFEVIQALRSRPQTQHTPVVVMTTRAGDKHRQMALSIGASSYVAKPVEERALLQEVERWVGRARAVRK